jgi:hypothetical protein
MVVFVTGRSVEGILSTPTGGVHSITRGHDAANGHALCNKDEEG